MWEKRKKKESEGPERGHRENQEYDRRDETREGTEKEYFGEKD